VTVYSADWVLPVDGAPIQGGGVRVEDGVIVAVGEPSGLAGGREHFPGCVIAPGFVNAHTHLEYAAYAGFGDGQGFGSWLELHIERKRLLDWEHAVAVARAGAADCLASGIATVADASFSGAAAIAASELGLRAIVYLEVFGDDATELETRFGPSLARIEGTLSDRVRLGVSPHAPYTAGLALYRACLELRLPTATHLAESDREADSPGIRELAESGVLTSSLAAAHCVTVDADEIALLAHHDVGVVHCPRSNAMLGCGIAPLGELLAAGVRVGLGTDSPASTPSFDMFDEMRAAIWLARARAASPTAISPAETLRLATLGSAEALGLADEVGSLTPGKRADLCVVDLAGSPFDPIEDPATALVLGGAPARVCRTIVQGVTRYVRGETEWPELRRSAAAARARMLGQPGSP
jgi:cytosine/adenosine deaminase-related metal-dependent hydrolase